MGREAMAALAGYVRGTAFVALIDAVFIGLGFRILGVPLVLPIALLTFFAAFIPIVGAVASGAVGVLIALADGGVTKAALALGIVLLVQQLEGNVVQPLAVGRSVRLHPIVTIAAVAVGRHAGRRRRRVRRRADRRRRLPGARAAAQVNIERAQEALLVPEASERSQPGAARGGLRSGRGRRPRALTRGLRARRLVQRRPCAAAPPWASPRRTRPRAGTRAPGRATAGARARGARARRPSTSGCS